MKQKIAFAMIMGLISTCIISFTLISINVGFNGSFIRIWMRSWGMGYLVVIPAILILSPLVQRLVDKLFKSQTKL
jgi:hypothetical protein